MKSLSSIFLGILILINFSCQNETVNDLKKKQEKPKKTLLIIKREITPENTDDIKEIIDRNKNFIKILESFKQKTYSTDELIDLTNKDLELFLHMRNAHFKSTADTAAVKSRLLLTEISLKKLNFLLHKKKIETDTVQKTFNQIINNLNSVIQKIRLYSQSTDEFESILAHDSIAKIKRDSILKNKRIRDSLKIKDFY